MIINLLQHFCSFAQTTIIRIMPLGCLKRNYYYSGNSNMMIIKEKLVISTYFFSCQEMFYYLDRADEKNGT